MDDLAKARDRQRLTNKALIRKLKRLARDIKAVYLMSEQMTNAGGDTLERIYNEIGCLVCDTDGVMEDTNEEENDETVEARQRGGA